MVVFTGSILNSRKACFIVVMASSLVFLCTMSLPIIES